MPRLRARAAFTLLARYESARQWPARAKPAAAIEESFGRFDALKSQMTEAALNVQGAGWGTMAWEPLGQRLIVEQVYDHQGNVGNGAVPLLVLDMWEHAHYLQYENAKADWVTKYQ